MYLRDAVAQLVKNPSANAGDERDVGSIPRSGRSPGEGNGNPLQYSCLEKSTDREASAGFQSMGWPSRAQLSSHAHSGHSDV